MRKRITKEDLLDIPAFLLRKNWTMEDHERSRKAWDQIMHEKRESLHRREIKASAGVVQIVEALKQGNMTAGMLEQSLMAKGFPIDSVGIQKSLRLLIRRRRVEFVNDVGVYRLVEEPSRV